MNFDQILLEPEQGELFVTLVEAQQQLPRNEQQDFKFSPALTRSQGARPRADLEKAIDSGSSVMFQGKIISKKEDIPWNLDHDMLFHPGLPNGHIDTFQSDIDALTLYDLIRFRDKEKFFLTPTGLAYYRQSKTHQEKDGDKVVPTVIPNRPQPHPIEEIPVEIKESLEKFKADYPDSRKVAFVMTRFGKTKAHESIISGIRKALLPLGISAVRADDKQYHDDLFPNVLTYVYGCGFGIAVFERIESEEFNPNVALEVGYMFALRKQVCLLKDKTLKTLHADLVGKLYKVFDAQAPIESIPTELSQWLRDKGFQAGEA
jgi:hypothetical protein